MWLAIGSYTGLALAGRVSGTGIQAPLPVVVAGAVLSSWAIRYGLQRHVFAARSALVAAAARPTRLQPEVS